MNISLREKSNRLYAVIGYYDDAGNYKQKWIALNLSAKNNKRKAGAMLPEVLERFQKAIPTKNTPSGKLLDMSFVDFAKMWLENKKGTVETSTWEGYKIYTERHIIPYFDQLRLGIREIYSAHIKIYYENKFRTGRCDGKHGGLSIASLKKHALTLRNIFDYAVELGYIEKNPAIGVRLPKREETRPHRVFLNLEQAKYVLSLFEGQNLKPIVFFALYYGLRRSEILGLRWDAVDFESKEMAICHTVVKNLTIVAKDKTKNETSRSTYPLNDIAIALLKSEKEKQIKMRAFYGKAYKDEGYVFTWEDGTSYNPDYITRKFQKVVKSSGMPKMRFHDLRHSTASILHDLGWDIKDIQEWMRHKSIETTADIYTHVSKARIEKIANGLSEAFSDTKHQRML